MSIKKKRLVFLGIAIMLTAVLCCVYTMAAGENYVASTDADSPFIIENQTI